MRKIKNENTLTIKECAEILGMSAQGLRNGIQTGAFKFATPIPSKKEPLKKGEKQIYDYHIPRQAAEHYMKYGNLPVVIQIINERG